MLELNKIHHGHVLDLLKKIPDESTSMVVTSPPYWGLRDYGVDNQLGLEATPEGYVANLVKVFDEIKRVLRPWGTLWLNLGDSYARNGGEQGGGNRELMHLEGKQKRMKSIPKYSKLKPKDLMGMPWMVAFALRDAGWYLRSDIIWAKTNPMPESVTDRPTKAHEYVFLLSKSQKYFYDAHAIKEPSTERPSGNKKRFIASETGERARLNTHMGSNVPYKPDGTGRNKRTVWSIATQPFPEAHFATFPMKLIEPCILAGCPNKVCIECGKPREKIIERKSNYKKREPAHQPGNTPTKVDSTGWTPPTITIKGYTDCNCGKGFEPGVVLDPFMGAGTAAIVARSLQRNYIGIELNQEYIEIANKRLEKELKTE